MAVKTFRQVFNTFKGLHEGYTHLTRPLEYASECDNLVLDRQNNLVGRFGNEPLIFPPLDASTGTCDLPNYGLHNYEYQANDGSGIVSELIGIGNAFFRLKKGTFTAAYSGAATTADISHHILADVWTFELREDGVSVSTTTDSSWDSLGSGGLGLYWNLINSLSGWTCTVTGLARVDGAVSSVGLNTAITVDAGHSVTVATDRATMLLYNNTNGTPDQGIDWATVVEVGATSIRIKPKTSSAIDLANNAYLGTGLIDVRSLPYFYQADCKGATFSCDFYYWEKVPWGADISPSVDATTTQTAWKLSPKLTSLSKNNDIRYFPGSPEFQSYKLITYDNTVYTAAQGNAGSWKVLSTEQPTKSGLFQYDGQSWHQAMLPPQFVDASDHGAGSLAAGTYKYIARLKYIDYQGNEHFGAERLKSGAIGYTSVTIAASREIRLDFGYLNSLVTTNSNAGRPPLRINVADNAGTQSFTANTPVAITVLSASDSDRRLGLYIGDTASFVNATTNQIVRGPVTAINYVGATSYTITVTLPEDGTIADGAFITNNFVIEIFRTEPNNNQFYYLAEVPCGISTSETYDDNTVSVVDNALYDGPFIGAFRRDVAPQLSTLETHQGLLIGAGNPDRPNSLYWCNADDPWNWSASTNELTIVPGGSGTITAIASSDDNTLAVFSERGVSFLAGDFASGNLSEIKRYRGDCGCPSRHGAIKIRDELWWLSFAGPRRAQGALLLPAMENFTQTLDAQDYKLDYTNGNSGFTDRLLVKKCYAVNVEDGQFAIWAIPKYTYDSGQLPSTNNDSIQLYYDYQSGFFSIFSCQSSVLGLGVWGLASFDGRLCQLLNNGIVARQMGDYENSATEYWKWNFLEIFKAATEYDLKLAFDTLGEPSVDKQFLRLKIYSEASSTKFSSWQTTVSTNRNFVLTGGTSTAITFSSASTYESEAIKLFSEKARAMQFRLLASRGGSSSYEAGPKYTGIEYEVALDYKKEEVSKS